MSPRHPNLGRLIDELANALQAAVLIAEHMQLASSATAQDAIALSRNLRRATDTIQQFRVERGNE